MRIVRLRKRTITDIFKNASAPRGYVEDISTDRVQVGIVELEPGEAEQFGLHYHRKKESLVMVLDGKGKAVINGKEVTLEPGTAIVVPPMEKHFAYLGVKPLNGKPLRLIDIGVPPEEGHVFASE